MVLYWARSCYMESVAVHKGAKRQHLSTDGFQVPIREPYGTLSWLRCCIGGVEKLC